MASLDDAAEIALALPQVSESDRRGSRVWAVAGKTFAWERSFSKADLRRFGDAGPPEGPILAVRTADLGEKEALLAAHPDELFTIAHFDGFAAVLVRLTGVRATTLEAVLLDGWRARAPRSLADDHARNTTR
jgi:hypothetical protein